MKGPESKVNFSVTLEELYNGVRKEFSVNRNVYCSKCKGSGAEGGKTKTCPKCKGQGIVKVIQNMGFMQMQTQ
jgi:DnaJ-class molecular chaperone